MNVRIGIDAAAFSARWTDEEPDGEFVFATLKDAKVRALSSATAERNAWATCVRNIRSFTLDEITPAWD
jgi:hypothetical protein